MSKPKRYGYEDITAAERDRWEAKHGEYWADIVKPEDRTTVWDFDTIEEMKTFAASSVPSGYYSRAFERLNIHWEYGWEYDEKEIEL